ncbi:leucine-rich repeat protein [Treponema endosymbiont of Eucomonympha sp.]|uniref:leucine-rich repeat protein n=1 Tax=Treponema endosymbiont of Eucomonympha sp. TaxID=1580831 RepID=UPI00139675FC|nr:leucine-rich repeat domain-containing protein [Treponema endosymbiont of Eucomonympha sp.]
MKLSVDLSEQETSIESLFAALTAADKYVDLDLSGCTGLTEWGAYTDAGKVVSLVLPDTVTKIAESPFSAPTFASFASLETLTAKGVKTVGDYAFYRHAALTSISMPSATAIEAGAFQNCAALASVSLPAAETIGTGA